MPLGQADQLARLGIADDEAAFELPWSGTKTEKLSWAGWIGTSPIEPPSVSPPALIVTWSRRPCGARA